MIIYTTKCLLCHDKHLWKKVKAFCKLNNLTLEERRVNVNTKWREEAEQYGLHMPFAVEGKVALSLSEDLEGLL